MIIGICCFNLCSLSIRHLQNLNPQFGSLEIMLIRGVSQAFVQTILMNLFKTSFKQLTRQQWRLLITRSCLSMVGMQLAWSSFPYLSLGLFSTIYNLSPLLTMVSAYIFLNEKLSMIEVFTILCSFGGAVLLIMFSSNEESQDEGISSLAHTGAVIGCTLYAALAALVFVVIRSLKGVHYTIINTVYAYMLITAAIFCIGAKWLTSSSGKDYHFD